MRTKELQLDWREGRRRRAWELAQQGNEAAHRACWQERWADPSRPIRQGLPAGGHGEAPAPGAVAGLCPELNPDEGIWNYLKRVEMGNRCCRDLAELHLALRRAKERLRHKRTVIQACVRQAGYRV